MTDIIVRRYTNAAEAEQGSGEERKMFITTEDRSIYVVVPFAPREIDYGERARKHDEIERPGREPVLSPGGVPLATQTFSLIIADRDNEVDVEETIDLLELIAASDSRVVVNFGPREAGLWRMTGFTYASTNRHPVTQAITQATAEVTLTRASDYATRVGPLTGGASSGGGTSGGSGGGGSSSSGGGTAKPAAAKPVYYGGVKHVVRKGDTLGKLSTKYYKTNSKWRLIADKNGIRNAKITSHWPNYGKMKPGKIVFIPRIRGMTVQPLPVMKYVNSLVIRGKTLQGELAEALTAAEASIGVDQIGEVTLTFYDPYFDLLESGLFVKGAACNFQTFAQTISAVETGAATDGLGQTTVRARSRAITALKDRRGSKVMSNASPSDFVISECRALGIPYVVESSARVKSVARDTAVEDPKDPILPSSWTTFERLARELGFIVFESSGVVYFAKPSYLRKRTSRLSVVTWNTGAYTDCLAVPEFRTAIEDNEPVSASIQVPRDRIRDFMPGNRVRVVFSPFGDDNYLVTGLSFPIAGDGDAEVTIGKPEDPTPEPADGREAASSGGGTTGTRNGGGGGSSGTAAAKSATKAKVAALAGSGTKSRRLGALLYKAGFRGEALKIAAGIAIAESGGFKSGRWYVNAKAIGDVGLQNAKWGPSVGVFQIRSLRHPAKYSGNDRLRYRSKLDDALYNARTAYKISKGGTDWSAWSVFKNGKYKQHVGKTGAIVNGWAGTTGGGSPGKKKKAAPAKTSAAGRKSASDFVTVALRQVGDTYRFGAEASGKNPSAFDCSELVQWAAGRTGVFMPDGSSNQIAHCRNKGRGISVEKGIRTRGALLWKPGHIAISLGNGRTVEAVNPAYGVRTMSARDRTFRWQGAGLIPGMRY